jgi:hypothetical protein
VVVRFTEAEFVVVRERAAWAGLAVGAWIGATVVADARCEGPVTVDLPDLLRLHADVVAVRERADGAGKDELAVLLCRLDVVIDAVVAEVERQR